MSTINEFTAVASRIAASVVQQASTEAGPLGELLESLMTPAQGDAIEAAPDDVPFMAFDRDGDGVDEELYVGGQASSREAYEAAAFGAPAGIEHGAFMSLDRDGDGVDDEFYLGDEQVPREVYERATRSAEALNAELQHRREAAQLLA